MAQTVKRLPTVWETWVRSLGQEDLLEQAMVIYSSTLAGKSHGRRSVAGYSPWGCQESDATEQLHFLFLYLIKAYYTPDIIFMVFGSEMEQER